MSDDLEKTVDRAIAFADLKRKYTALLAGIEEDPRRKAEGILNSMDEEAANLRPAFNQEERDITIRALRTVYDKTTAEAPVIERVIEKLMLMHITDVVTSNSDGRLT